MPGAVEIAAAHYRRQQAIARRVAAELEQMWRSLDATDLVGSWAAVAGRADQLVAVGQYASTRESITFVAAATAAQAADPKPLGALDPRAFTGTAADGRSLSGLLLSGVYRSRELLAAGAPLEEALTSGQARLLRAAVNEVVQAGISSASAAIAVTPTLVGYTRVLSPPSCSRCVILAGKYFRHNAGFQRHPLCDCIHLPTAEGQTPLVRNPEAAFDAMTPAEQDDVFTKAGAEAIRAGADMGRVVNARQSTYVPTGRRTARGTPTRRTVEDLLERAGTDRNKFAALLDSAGYFL